MVEKKLNLNLFLEYKIEEEKQFFKTTLENVKGAINLLMKKLNYQ